MNLKKIRTFFHQSIYDAGPERILRPLFCLRTILNSSPDAGFVRRN
jgi:hypothetical protein